MSVDLSVNAGSDALINHYITTAYEEIYFMQAAYHLISDHLR